MLKLYIKSIVFLFWVQIFHAQSHSDKLNVLMVDGFNNHDWKQTSLIVKTILEKSDLFDVDISTTPSEPEDIEWINWRPKFKDYDVVIQNTNNIHRLGKIRTIRRWVIHTSFRKQCFFKMGCV